MRRGYMGHLTRIANTIVHNLEKGPVHTQINTLIAGVFSGARGGRCVDADVEAVQVN